MITKIYLDMDDVIAAFMKSPMLKPTEQPRQYNDYSEMYEEGYFETLPVIPSSLSNVRKLIALYPDKVSILSQPVAKSAHSYAEKARWIMKWFPELHDKITLTQDKEELSREGRALIDDNIRKWGGKWSNEGGLFIHFETAKPEESWERVFSTLASYEKMLLTSKMEK